jgi:hypothetical protein
MSDDETSDVWKTKEGRLIQIVELENGHLLNIIRLIERMHAAALTAYMIGPEPQGEMAKDAFDREFDALDEEGPSGFHEQYDLLCEEADRRRIDSPEIRRDRLAALDLLVLDRVARRR